MCYLNKLFDCCSRIRKVKLSLQNLYPGHCWMGNHLVPLPERKKTLNWRSVKVVSRLIIYAFSKKVWHWKSNMFASFRGCAWNTCCWLVITLSFSLVSWCILQLTLFWISKIDQPWTDVLVSQRNKIKEIQCPNCYSWSWILPANLVYFYNEVHEYFPAPSRI